MSSVKDYQFKWTSPQHAVQGRHRLVKELGKQIRAQQEEKKRSEDNKEKEYQAPKLDMTKIKHIQGLKVTERNL